jgi:hypothetical protein
VKIRAIVDAASGSLLTDWQYCTSFLASHLAGGEADAVCA